MSKRQGTLNAAYSSKIRAKSGKLARSGLYKHLNELLYYNQIVCIEYNPSCDIFTKTLISKGLNKDATRLRIASYYQQKIKV